MRVVTIARKPLSEKTISDNVIKHGAGGLQVGNCGIPTMGGKKRYPVNVLLVHRAGCRIEGTLKVSSGTAVRRNSGGKNIFSEDEKPPMEDMTYAGPDGLEEIPNWVCVEGCPVGHLHATVGIKKSGTNAIKKKSARGSQGTSMGKESRPVGTVVTTHGDSGYVSRYFMQFIGILEDSQRTEL